MLYRIKDLKRNELGKRFEKEVAEITSYFDGPPYAPIVEPHTETKKRFYGFELAMQKECRFCANPSDVSDGGDEENNSGSSNGGIEEEGKKKEEEEDKELVDTTLSNATDDTETTYTEHVTENYGGYGKTEDYVPNENEYGWAGGSGGSGGSEENPIQKVDIDRLPILPVRVMPTTNVPTKPQTRDTPPPVQKKTTPNVVDTKKVTDNKQVTKNVVPKNLQKTAQQHTDEILSKNQQTATIDHLQVWSLSFDNHQKYANKLHNSKKDAVTKNSSNASNEISESTDSSTSLGNNIAKAAELIRSNDTRTYDFNSERVKGDNLVDCSEFASEVQKATGYKFGPNASNASGQLKELQKNGVWGTRIKDVKVGDQVFFGDKDKEGNIKINHTGIVVAIHSDGTFDVTHATRNKNKKTKVVGKSLQRTTTDKSGNMIQFARFFAWARRKK